MIEESELGIYYMVHGVFEATGGLEFGAYAVTWTDIQVLRVLINAQSRGCIKLRIYRTTAHFP